MKTFKFGIMPYIGSWEQPMSEQVKNVKQYERLGYDTLYQCDHFFKTTYDPIAMLTSAATATEKLKIGSLVFDVDYRHPAVLAKAAATMHLLSNGRYEFGIGAGWLKLDYDMTGIQFDRPSKRIERLEEALKIIKGMWTQDNTNFKGKYFQINNIEKAGELLEGNYPKILVGGGGKKVLSVAGRHADIVGINLFVPDGNLTNSIRWQSIDRVIKQIGWVEAAAKDYNRSINDIELHMHIPWIKITDEPELEYKRIAEQLELNVDEVIACPKIQFGSCSEIVRNLKELHESTGISYYSFGLSDTKSINEFANSCIMKLKS